MHSLRLPKVPACIRNAAVLALVLGTAAATPAVAARRPEPEPPPIFLTANALPVTTTRWARAERAAPRTGTAPDLAPEADARSASAPESLGPATVALGME